MSDQQKAFEAWCGHSRSSHATTREWDFAFKAWLAATLAERERCAKVCESEAMLFDIPGAHRTATHCAAAIRGKQ